MYVNLPKKFITKNLLPHLSQTNLGRKTKVPLWRIVRGIIFRVKTGCQWLVVNGVNYQLVLFVVES